MGVAFMEVEYEIAGRRYRTVHGAWSGATAPLTTFGNEDYTNWGGALVGDPNFEAATDPTNNTQDPRTLIEAILYFHRYMQSPAVILRNLSINDGPTPGTSTGNFVSLTLDLQCRGNPTVNVGTLGPLNCTMMITKQPLGFSERKGRMFLRGAVVNSHMMFGDADGATFAPGFRSAYQSELFTGGIGNGVGVSTLLYSYMGGGATGPTGDEAAYVIPNTIKVTGTDPVTGQPTTKRVLANYTLIDNMTVTDVQSRDTRRKAKRR